MNERTVFLAALEQEDSARRREYLDGVCAGDPALRERVEALLRAHEREGKFLDVPAPEQLAPAGDTRDETPDSAGGDELSFFAPSDMPGSLGRLGHYEVQQVVGKGGMGVVLKAFDEKLHRVVAIKVLAAQLATCATARRRFTREAQAAAAVSHDHVVTIHAVEEAGTLPYLVMQYVAGLSLQQRLERDGPLDLPEVLRIGAQTAAGLAAAHAQGLVHRDIKPANILLENGVERVKITDFGLARAAAEADLTQTGVVAGTPQYMSPEQAEGKAVDQRTDLFSLGSVLYAMCTGRAPFRASGSMAVLKRVCEQPPSPIRDSRPETPEWLVAIIDRLHAKDPAERFQSAAEVAELLNRHLAHVQHPSLVPLPAPIRRPARQSFWSRRGRGRWAFAAAILVLAVGSLSLTEATGVTGLTATVVRVLTPDGTLVVEVDDPAVRVSVEGDGGLDISGAGLHRVRLRPGSYRVRAAKDGKEIPVDNDLVTITRGGKQLVKVSREPAGPPAFTFSPPPAGPLDKLDPANIPAAERFPWQPKELVAVLGEHRQRHWGPATCVAYSPDGRWIASGGEDQVVRIWDAKTLRERAVLRGHTRDVWSVAFSPSGRRVLSGGWDNTMRLWDADTGAELRRFDLDAQTSAIAFSPDGRRALSAGTPYAQLWDLESGARLRRYEGHTRSIQALAFTSDGRQALTGGGDGTVRLWDVEGGHEIHCLKGHRGQVRAVALSPDGRLALSGNHMQKNNNILLPAPDYDLRLWDLKTGTELRRFAAHARAVRGVAFSPDGQRALSCDDAGLMRVWDVKSGTELRHFAGHVGRVFALAYSPDGRRAASAGDDGTVRVWDTEAGKELRPVTGPTDRAYQVAFSPSGTHILSAGGDRVVRRWDAVTAKETRRFVGHTDPVISLSLSGDGRRLLTGSCNWDWHQPRLPDWDREGPWRLWDVATGRQVHRFRGPSTEYVGCVALSTDGKRALTGSGKRLLLWDVESERELRAWDTHTGDLSCVAFSADGMRAVSGDSGGALRTWDVQRGQELRRMACPSIIYGVATSPDGHYAVSGSWDRTVRLWDLSGNGAADRVFPTWHTAAVYSVAFAPDGRAVASAGADGRVVLWDVATGDKVREWQLAGPVRGVMFARDGRHLATANGNGTVYVLRSARP